MIAHTGTGRWPRPARRVPAPGPAFEGRRHWYTDRQPVANGSRPVRLLPLDPGPTPGAAAQDLAAGAAALLARATAGATPPSTVDTLRWGRLPSASATPVATVSSGDVLTLDTLSHEGALEDQGRDPLTFFARHGSSAVFFARWLPGLRVVTSWLAGADRMPWRRFLVWNALGGITWAATIGGLAYVLGRSASGALGAVGFVALGAAAVVFVVMHLRHGRP